MVLKLFISIFIVYYKNSVLSMKLLYLDIFIVTTRSVKSSCNFHLTSIHSLMPLLISIFHCKSVSFSQASNFHTSMMEDTDHKAAYRDLKVFW